MMDTESFLHSSINLLRDSKSSAELSRKTVRVFDWFKGLKELLYRIFALG